MHRPSALMQMLLQALVDTFSSIYVRQKSAVGHRRGRLTAKQTMYYKDMRVLGCGMRESKCPCERERECVCVWGVTLCLWYLSKQASCQRRFVKTAAHGEIKIGRRSTSGQGGRRKTKKMSWQRKKRLCSPAWCMTTLCRREDKSRATDVLVAPDGHSITLAFR